MKIHHRSANSLIVAVALVALCGGCSCGGGASDGGKIVDKAKTRPDAGTQTPALKPTKALPQKLIALQSNKVYRVTVDNFGVVSKKSLEMSSFDSFDNYTPRVQSNPIRPYPNSSKRGKSYIRDFQLAYNTKRMSTSALLDAMDGEGLRPAMQKELIALINNGYPVREKVYALGSSARFRNGQFISYATCITTHWRNDCPEKGEQYLGMTVLDPYGYEQWSPGSIFLVTQK